MLSRSILKKYKIYSDVEEKMKKLLTVILAASLVFSFCACGEEANESKELVMTTGNETGTYYAYGTVLANYVSKKTDYSITAVAGKGSKANIEDMDADLAQLGFCQSDVMSYAYNGERLFDGKKITNFSAVAALYMEQLQIVTTNPDVKTVSDLAGKVVSVGESGSGTYFNALDVLSAYGMTEDDISPVYQSFSDSAESLKDGKIDAAFIVAGAPTNAITDLATGKDVNLVEIDAEHINSLLESCPYYNAYTVPADMYKGMTSDVQTVAIAAMVLARDDVSEDAVYSFLKTIFEDTAAVTEQNAKGSELNLTFASSVTSVPFHKGAVKFFAENSITVSGK